MRRLGSSVAARASCKRRNSASQVVHQQAQQQQYLRSPALRRPYTTHATTQLASSTYMARVRQAQGPPRPPAAHERRPLRRWWQGH
jgi:hypothetical protein